MPNPPAPDRLALMLDKFELQELVTTYCRAADRGDMALMATLYDVDAIDDHGGMFCGPAAEFIRWLPGMLANFAAVRHTISNALFVVEGDRAEGEVHCEAYHRTAGAAPREIVIGGRYLDRYIRRDGVWKFLHRSLVHDWSLKREADVAGDGRTTEGVAFGRGDRQDPSYLRLPLLADLARRRETL